MYSLDEAKVKAGILCGSTRQPVDVYEVDKGHNFKLTSLRRSPKHVLRLTHENKQIIIKDAKGKKVDSIDTAPKVVKKKEEK